MRVLITASRSWDRPDLIWTVLDIIAKEAAAAGDTSMTVVHGCAKGGDTHADNWVRKGGQPLDVTAERHPPNYTKYGKRAPWVRDSEMVRAGANVCLAFIRDDSKGASGTAAMAEAADIPTQRFYYVEPDRES